MDIEVRCVQILAVDLGDQLCEPELDQRTQYSRVFGQLFSNTGKKPYLIAFASE